MLFENGSAVCGAAPTSTAFIIGRAIAGLGPGGYSLRSHRHCRQHHTLAQEADINGLCRCCIWYIKRGGSVTWGAFTKKVSWRWCFYRNLPIEEITIVVFLLILKIPNPKNASTLKERLAQLDPRNGGFPSWNGLPLNCPSIRWFNLFLERWAHHHPPGSFRDPRDRIHWDSNLEGRIGHDPASDHPTTQYRVRDIF